MTRIAGYGRAVLSDWAVLSPYGAGADAFAAGVRAGQPAATPLEPSSWRTPYPQACLVPDFEPAAVLGPKGTRAMDRVTGIAVTTVGLLLAGHPDGGLGGPTEIGLVLGTTTGSVHSMMRFTRDSLTAAKPYHVDPAQFPNTVMNRAAGQSAIWHRLKGPNTTVAGGAVTGLLALNYALRLQRSGTCQTMLCGAVEEFSEERAWLSWHARSAGVRPTLLGEGGAVFLVEPASQALARGRRPLAEICAAEFRGFADLVDARAALRNCVLRVLAAAGVRPAEVGVVAPAGAEGPMGEAEAGALADVLEPSVRTVGCRELMGDTAAASAAFQLAAALVVAGPAGAPYALVTSLDPDGVAGCVLLAVSADPTPLPAIRAGSPRPKGTDSR